MYRTVARQRRCAPSGVGRTGATESSWPGRWAKLDPTLLPLSSARCRALAPSESRATPAREGPGSCIMPVTYWSAVSHGPGCAGPRAAAFQHAGHAGAGGEAMIPEGAQDRLLPSHHEMWVGEGGCGGGHVERRPPPLRPQGRGAAPVEPVREGWRRARRHDRLLSSTQRLGEARTHRPPSADRHGRECAAREVARAHPCGSAGGRVVDLGRAYYGAQLHAYSCYDSFASN
jgi:hypothetical protein